MFGIPTEVHDLIFAVGALVLFLALVPAVIKKSVLPYSTCYITGGVLFIFSLNYFTMEYWYAVVVEALNVACWAYLLWIAWKSNKKIPLLTSQTLTTKPNLETEN